MKDYPVTHQTGTLSIEMDLRPGLIEGDVGVQIAKDGRIWVCLNGAALIRFKPKRKGGEAIGNNRNNKEH